MSTAGVHALDPGGTAVPVALQEPCAEDEHSTAILGGLTFMCLWRDLLSTPTFSLKQNPPSQISRAEFIAQHWRHWRWQSFGSSEPGEKQDFLVQLWFGASSSTFSPQKCSAALVQSLFQAGS